MKKEELNDTMVENPLLKKKIAICPIYREGGWLPKNHDGAFLNSGAQYTLRGTPLDVTKGVFIDPLTDEEKRYFIQPELGLGIKLEDLSPYKQRNFWSTFQVSLSRDPIILDLSNPMDYLKYKFLLAQRDNISPSWTQRFDKGTYKFSIKDDEADSEEEMSRIDLELDVMKEFDKIQGSIRKMSALLTLYYQKKNQQKRIPADASTSFLKAEISKIIKADVKTVHEVINDPFFGERVLVAQAIEKGVIRKLGSSEYQIVGEEDKLNLRELLDFLKSKKNQPVRMKIEAQLENQS